MRSVELSQAFTISAAAEDDLAVLPLRAHSQIQRETGVSYLLISHDLAVVRAVARRVAIMDAGRIVESGDPSVVFSAPQSHATRLLVEAVPRLSMRS